MGVYKVYSIVKERINNREKWKCRLGPFVSGFFNVK